MYFWYATDIATLTSYVLMPGATGGSTLGMNMCHDAELFKSVIRLKIAKHDQYIPNLPTILHRTVSQRSLFENGNGFVVQIAVVGTCTVNT